ncbi:YdcF family protein [Aquibacillus koreensis]|uniref:YdcF family protein n=1 Tax=Aquibacillus koreensis TaxID=279446 RepID=A0A9X3WRE5_9BACI|nr:YdcF family protein [Aquibacillus koreensis]MCT2536211.1 YdcF family protein [Aquibacillus koreensis]MDC3422024.1 YdcF family protein [Aquibacillus koreensis]
MKPIIPKETQVPNLTSRQIEELTNIIFLPAIEVPSCDAIFVFAGTHPGHWEKPIEAYKKGYCQKLIVTGGVSPTGVKHPDWKDRNQPEADVIVSKLLESGIKQEDIVFENRSRNTLENVLLAKEVFDFSSLESLLFVCKNHAAGRQYRTLAQHIPNKISYIPFGFDAEYRGCTVSRDNWMKTEIGRARVLGEYFRILHYGKIGHILPLETEVEDLEEFSA